MHVLVVGATGFVGRFVIERLKREDVGRICCLVRKSSQGDYVEENDVEIEFGDLADVSSICDALREKEALISIASLKYGFCKNLVHACEVMKIKRAVFISTTGIFTQLESKEKRMVIEAENTVSRSRIDYTILRPTMIYGSQNDMNMHFLIAYLRGHSFIPIFGSGRYLQQPVYVEDVASAVVHSLVSRKTIGKRYNISGRFPISFNGIIDTICSVLGKNVLKIHIPYHLSLVVVGAAQIAQRNPRFTIGQVRRLNENKTFDYSRAREDFGYYPIAFEDGVRRQIESMD